MYELNDCVIITFSMYTLLRNVSIFFEDIVVIFKTQGYFDHSL